MRAYITGIAGFLGSHLAEYLLAEGWDITGGDDHSSGDVGRVPATVWWSPGDLSYGFDVPSDTDVIFNCAAHARTLEVEADPQAAWNANVDIAVHAAHHARELDIPLVHASSCIVYGPDCHYRRQKIRAEQLIAHYGGVSLRFANLYGCHQSERGVYPNVLAAMKRDARAGHVHVSGNGTQTRDFLHISDAARAMATFFPASGTYDVCTGTQTSILDAAQLFSDAIIFTRAREIDTPHIDMDPTAAAEDFGFRYTVEPLAGIKEYAND